jgi:diacylglycerol kinase
MSAQTIIMIVAMVMVVVVMVMMTAIEICFKLLTSTGHNRNGL